MEKMASRCFLMISHDKLKNLPKECFALCEENFLFGNRAIDLFHPTFYSLHGNDKVNECKISVGETGRRVYYKGKLR